MNSTIARYKNGIRRYLDAVFHSYSEIFFLQHFAVGILLFFLTFLNPNVAAAGIISVAAAYLFSRFIHMGKVFLSSGFYTYNPLLVGLSIGYLFKLTPLTIFFVVASGILTLVLTVLMFSIFNTYLKLPILSLPFVVVSSIAYLASSRYSNLFVSGMYLHRGDQLELYLPFWLAGYLKAFGAVFFMPDVAAGAVIALLILAASRILFLLSVAGYFSGALLNSLLVGSFVQGFSNINHFNFILIAMAVGGIFLIPSPRSYLLALIAVSVSLPLQDSVLIFWSYYGIPGFTLPFNIVSLAFVYVLGLIQYPQLARLVRKTPEETLDLYLSNQRRFKGSDKTVMLPFAGKWTVWQAFDGKWTHKGSWKYAYDFIITDDSGKSFRGSGKGLEDYYCYRKPVLSPVRGRVVKVIQHLSDNPVNTVDKTNNWGNLVIIHDDRGFFVEISHLSQNSVKVKEGDWVARGALLGLCGNSGYSPQPHIHLQVQQNEEQGSYTIPFSIVSYAQHNRYQANNLPPEGAEVEPLQWDRELDNKTNFILDNEFHYEIYRQGKRAGNLNLAVRMAADGTFYLDSGRGKLYFGKHEGTFYFYQVEGKDPLLNAMLLALPRLPAAYRQNLQWTDSVPLGLVSGGLKRAAVQFASSFYHNFARIQVEQTFTARNRIDGQVKSRTLNLQKNTSVELSKTTGFKTFRVNNLELRRINE
ncbi:MAG: urea transporter [Calditrichia bacterium]